MRKLLRGVLYAALVWLLFPKITQAASIINFTTGASRYGNNVYYTLDYVSSPAGNLCRYNIKTHKNTLIAKGKYVEVLADSKYLYVTENLGYGADSWSYTIYRMNKSGKNRKMLDYGSSPVKVGNYIYYIRNTKDAMSGEYKNVIGIYRMSISGKNKKCILKLSSHSLNGLYELGYCNKKLYFCDSGGTFYSINLDGSKFKKIDIQKYVSSENGWSQMKVVCSGWTFQTSENSLYAVKGTVKKKIVSPEYSYSYYYHIVRVGDRIVVRTTQSARYWYYYIMKPDGTDKHYLCKQIIGN